MSARSTWSKRWPVGTVASIVSALGACKTTESDLSGSGDLTVAPRTRLDYIAQAEAWDSSAPIEISGKDLLHGPKNQLFETPKQEVACDFVEPDPENLPGGRTPKFECLMPNGDKPKKIKVKYDPATRTVNGKAGKRNHEVYGEVLATRLLWALGFAADRIYTVRLTCKGCPIDPWTYIRKKTGILDLQDKLNGMVRSDLVDSGDWQRKADLVFEPAVVELKYDGPRIESEPDSGWSWTEIYDHMARPDKQKLQRDLLTIMAAFINHMDNKASQQRLVCKDAESVERGVCKAPWLMIQDAGSSFGNGWAPLQGDLELNKVDLAKWKDLSLWHDAKTCTVQIHGALNASVRSKWQVSDEARGIAAHLLLRLGDQQLLDLFTAAQVENLGHEPREWVEAFKHKVSRDLVQTKCGG